MSDQEDREEKENKAEETEEVIIHDLKSCYFVIGEKEFSLDINNLKEITEVSDITAVPLSPMYLKGLFVLRGEVIPILDLTSIFNIEQPPLSDRKIVICEIQRGLLGFICDRMPDLQTEFKGTVIDIDRLFDQYRIKG